MTDPTSPGRHRVTGLYAGPVSRLAATALDAVIISVSFTLGVGLVTYLLQLLTPLTLDVGDDESWWWLAGLATWAGVYALASLSTVARTPGKAIVGLRVVGRDGSPLGAGRAAGRVVAFPLTFCTLGLGFVGIVAGREHRALHDVLAGTAVVYDWGDRPAELPSPLSRWLRRAGADPGR